MYILHTVDDLIAELQRYPSGTKIFKSNPEHAPQLFDNVQSFYYLSGAQHGYGVLHVLDVDKDHPNLPKEGELVCIV